MDRNPVEIKFHDVETLDASAFKSRYVGCVVLSSERKILLQQRGEDWNAYPGYLAEFGGKIEAGETPDQALVRELGEELGAKVNIADVVTLGAVTELSSHHSELVYVYFWHDKLSTITGCYEGECRYFENIEQAFLHPKMMLSVRWLLRECQRRGLV